MNYGRTLLIAIIAAAIFAPMTSLADTLYQAPQARKGTSLYSKLLYKLTLGTEDESTLKWDRASFSHDGSDIEAYFDSRRFASAYSVCLRAKLYDRTGSYIGRRYGCFDWFDTDQHSVTLVKASEARRVARIELHNFDVRGDGSSWDGYGRPSGTLSHQKNTYRVRGGRSVSIPAPVSVPRYSRSAVVRAVNAAARGVLFCAHPTAASTYRGVTVNSVNVSDSGVSADFTIGYRCYLGDRPCSMRLRVGYDSGRFTGVRVVSDTAFTNPTVGLRVCGDLVGMLR